MDSLYDDFSKQVTIFTELLQSTLTPENYNHTQDSPKLQAALCLLNSEFARLKTDFDNHILVSWSGEVREKCEHESQALHAPELQPEEMV